MRFKEYEKHDVKWDIVKDHAFCVNIPNPFLQVLYLHKDKIKNLQSIEYAIETGTYLGHSTVIFADCFSWVHTVEKAPVALTKFNNPIDLVSRYTTLRKRYPNISFNFSGSVSFLQKILKRYPDTWFVFLLDAHTIHTAPIIEELKAIEVLSNRDDHVLIIDDTADINNKSRGWPMQKEFENAILAINPDYQITYTPYGNRICIVYEGEI